MTKAHNIGLSLSLEKAWIAEYAAKMANREAKRIERIRRRISLYRSQVQEAKSGELTSLYLREISEAEAELAKLLKQGKTLD